MTNSNKATANARSGNEANPSLYRGAIVDANGREIPITEEMILEACTQLEEAALSVYPQTVRAAGNTGQQVEARH